MKDLAGNALANDYTWSFTTAAPDIIPPSITSVTPLNGATGVNIGSTITANLSEAINVSTVTATTFLLKDAGNNAVPATINALSNQITLVPSVPLAGGTRYTATIIGGTSGIKDLSGNALSNNYTWSFTTSANTGGSSIFLPSTVPASPIGNDGQAIEVGMKFRSTQNGYVTGIRYYKGEGFTGSRTGHLWTRTGALLATVTFTGETSSGWQQMTLSSPVAITANTTYVYRISVVQDTMPQLATILPRQYRMVPCVHLLMGKMDRMGCFNILQHQLSRLIVLMQVIIG